MNRVVITGIGAINSLGDDANTLYYNVRNKKIGIKKIERFATENLPIDSASLIENFIPEKYVNKRIVRKIDRFTQLALASTQLAVCDSKLQLDKEDKNQIGIYFGNNSGGWEVCEQGFKERYEQGAQYVNPWQATAWFPAAAQGYISIMYGIKGQSKTFVSDRVSGAQALYFAAHSIQYGRNKIIIAGGTEAPITPFGLCCYASNGEMKTKDTSDGIVLAEGSATLILEEYEHAKARNAHIYAEIIGCEMGNIKYNELECIKKFKQLKDNVGVNNISLIFPENSGNNAMDNLEHRMYVDLFGEKLPELLCVKKQLGHLYGAATPTDVVIACSCIEIEGMDKVIVNAVAMDGLDVMLILAKC